MIHRTAIPARYVLILLGFFGFFNLYAMRFNLSVAIVAMVKGSNKTIPVNGTDETVSCIELKETSANSSLWNVTTSRKGADFEWDSHEQGLVLGSFFYGYVATQIPGGILSERFGPKWVFGIGMLLSVVFTLLTPLAATWSVWALFMARIIEGLGQGVAFPAMNTMIGRWSPQLERSRISAFIYSGSQVGTVVALAVSGLLSDSDFLGGWPSVFYVFGIIGGVWLILWMSLIFDFPEDHPRISKEELLLIQEGKQNNEPKNRRPLPVKSILTSIPVWALFIAHFGYVWGFYTLVIQTPMYLSNVLHFELKKNGVLSALPNLIYFIGSNVSSVIADKLRKSGRLKITTIRKISQSIGGFGPSICLIAVTFMGCRPSEIVILITLGMGLNGFVSSGFFVTHVDMSPDFAGSLFGIANCMANVSGFLVPAFVGYMVESGQTLKNWGIVFITAAIVFSATTLVYDIFASAETQPWNEGPAPSDDEKPKDQTDVPEKLKPEMVNGEILFTSHM